MLNAQHAALDAQPGLFVGRGETGFTVRGKWRGGDVPGTEQRIP
jgi:hypothetical protein